MNHTENKGADNKGSYLFLVIHMFIEMIVNTMSVQMQSYFPLFAVRYFECSILLMNLKKVCTNIY